MNQQPKAMLLFLRIRGGTVALSPFQSCTPAKAMASTPKITKSATTLPIRGQSNRPIFITELEKANLTVAPVIFRPSPL